MIVWMQQSHPLGGGGLKFGFAGALSEGTAHLPFGEVWIGRGSTRTTLTETSGHTSSRGGVRYEMRDLSRSLVR